MSEYFSPLFQHIYHAVPDMLSFVQPTLITLQLALISLLIGLLLAIIFAQLERASCKPISWFTTGIVTLIRGLPELLVVVMIYNGIPVLLNLLIDGFTLNFGLFEWSIQFENLDIDVSPFSCGVIALALLYGAYGSQTLRGAFKSIPQGQNEAAQALCLGKFTTFSRIILPQMWRHALPGLTNQWLVLLKDTALVSLITVNDIMYHAQLIALKNISPFTWYLFAAAIYLLITLLSQKLIQLLEHKVNYYERRIA